MSGHTTLRIGTVATIKREVESLELTRTQPMMNVRLQPGQLVTVVAVNGTRVRVRTTGMGYETWVSASNVA